MMSDWEWAIREAASRIEDVLEYHVSSEFLSQSEALDGDDGEISNPLTLSDQYLAWELEDEIELLDSMENQEIAIVSICGPAGVGKSTLAKNVYEDPDIVRYFNGRAFVSIGLKHVRREILLDIEAQLNTRIVDKSHAETDEKLAYMHLYMELSYRRYLIVLDDVWTRQVWDDLKRIFPDNGNGSRGTCPPELEKLGKKIAKKCEGVPLKIIVIASLLCKTKMTIDYWEHVAETMNSFTDEDYDIQDLQQLTKSFLLDEDDATVSSRIDGLHRKKSKMVGLDDEVHEIMNLRNYRGSSERKIVSLVGMAGIGPKFSLEEIMLDILAELNFDITRVYGSLQEVSAMRIKKRLQGRKYFMVLDDIWNTQVWYELKKFIPDNKNGSVIMLTTRLEEVAKYANSYAIYRKRFLNREESCHLLCDKVFDKELCPSQLEKAGKKIAESCEGPPLAIIAISKHLSKAARTPQYWMNVAEKESATIIGEDVEVSKVLYLSYEYLLHHLKACFLYMGIFPRDYVIPASRLIKLWCSEGFLEPNLTKTLEDFAMECLQDLVSRSVVLLRQQNSTNKIKTCKVHSIFLYLCIKEVGMIQFFHVINSKASHELESHR
ncbi:Disease resistance protein RPP13 [Sesamum alatum]|uniref:Disease resistance protein RPP13 n=1 Tax=Sesamum alatum TaxID=300844 RepID=A0AAE1Y838_9LAMI|nr:Disease resistance protein RPP13 [Sesamum alatum]